MSRSLLRYHGGKVKLAPWIISHFPPHEVYVEAFGGAAGVFLQKKPADREVYNDLNGEVVNLFRVLRCQKAREELCLQVSLTPFSREDYELSCQPCEVALEQARRTIVRSHMGFGAMNMSGEATGFRNDTGRKNKTPAHDWGSYPDALAQFGKRLDRVVIENRDAAEVILQHDRSECLHYCDPPYVRSTRTSMTKHSYSHEMSDDDHRRLGAALRGVSGMVVLSGYPCALYDEELFPDWHRAERDSFADGARPRTEVLWINALAWNNLTNQGLFKE